MHSYSIIISRIPMHNEPRDKTNLKVPPTASYSFALRNSFIDRVSTSYDIRYTLSGKMDFSIRSHLSFINRPATDLPTPALVLSKPVLEKNIQQVLHDVEKLNIAFRPHVKTLKVLHSEFRPHLDGHGKANMSLTIVGRGHPHDAGQWRPSPNRSVYFM